MIGFNYRMTEMSAAVGLVQLENIEKSMLMKENISLNS